MFSYWEKDIFFKKQNVLIIGGGFVGLWSAITLAAKHPTHKITILDSGILPTGASTKNAGFSCFGSPTELLQDAAEYGEDAMWQLVEQRFKGLQKIQNSFSPVAIDYHNCGGYECLQEKENEQVIEKMNWLNNGLQTITGRANTFAYCKEKLPTFGLHGFHTMTENQLEGTLNPVLLWQQLYQKAIAVGVQFLNSVKVDSFEKRNGTIHVHTNNHTVSFLTNQLLICTNAFTKALLPNYDIIPGRGQVCITNPIDDLKLNGSFHYEHGFYYFRNVGNRLLIGGGRNIDFAAEETTTITTTETIQTELHRFIKTHLLPTTPFTITHSWSGIMAFGKAKKPIVQQVEEGVFCAVRMSGMGVALAPIVAEEVTALMI
jgi:gamma-glutamylputrescine oxidase